MTDIDRTAQLERACSYLRRIPAWYLATTDVADGHQPRVRPFSFAMVDDGKLWFCTPPPTGPPALHGFIFQGVVRFSRICK